MEVHVVDTSCIQMTLGGTPGEKADVWEAGALHVVTKGEMAVLEGGTPVGAGGVG